MKLSYHQLPQLVPLSTLHKHLGQLHNLPWWGTKSCSGQAIRDEHESTRSLNNFVFSSSLRGSNSSTMVSENAEVMVAALMCCMFSPFHELHVLPFNSFLSPAFQSNLFMASCEYFWGLPNSNSNCRSFEEQWAMVSHIMLATLTS